MAGIYIHVPFCSQACYYCDFHFSTSLKTQDRMLLCINREIESKKHYLNNPLIQTIYFGGGTPSLIPTHSIKAIINKINANFKLAKHVEITIESNPEDITEKKIKNWEKIGVNRISLGIQSFRNKDLIYMNRSHNKDHSFIALDLLQRSSINNISIDLIYGFPLLEDVDWVDNLKQALKYRIHHISCYCLTVEKKTALYQFIKKGQQKPLDPKKGARQFLLTRKVLKSAGYNHYEISNFALPKYESVHNKNYWNRTCYIGVGPSAHSFNGKSRQWNINNNNKYCSSIEKNDHYYTTEKLTNKNIINEYILISLRTSGGVDLDFLEKYMSQKDFINFNNQTSDFKKSNLLTLVDQKICLTEKGMLFADSISEDLFLI